MTNNTHRYALTLEIGEEAVRQERWQQALTCFQTALTGLPREPRVYNGLGDASLALADRTRALACYKEAARLAAENPTYIGKVAAVQEELGELSEAARHRLLSGDLYWSRRQPLDALAQWKDALRLRSDYVAAHERLAMAYRQKNDQDGSIHHYLALADILRREGRCLMALHICYTALTLSTKNHAVWSQTEQAWRCVAARDQQNPRQPGRVETGDLLNAAREFAQWQLTAEFRQGTLRPAETESLERYVHLRHAMLYEGYGNVEAAISCYEKAVSIGLTSPATFFSLGLLYRLAGRRKDARACFTLAARHPFYDRAIALLES